MQFVYKICLVTETQEIMDNHSVAQTASVFDWILCFSNFINVVYIMDISSIVLNPIFLNGGCVSVTCAWFAYHEKASLILLDPVASLHYLSCLGWRNLFLSFCETTSWKYKLPGNSSFSLYLFLVAMDHTHSI